MPDDDANDGDKHTATTVPPPAGEDDIYDAKTQVGGLPPEALAMLRAIRDEAPTGGSGKEANVPVFVEEEQPVSKPRPAAGMPAPRPAAGVPALPTPLMVPLTPNPLALRGPPTTPPSEPPPAVFSVKVPSAPVTADSVPPLVAPREAPSAEPESYEAVFAPLPPSTALPPVERLPPEPDPGTPDGGPSPLLVFGGFVVVAILIVVLAQARLIPGLSPPPSAPAPAGS